MIFPLLFFAFVALSKCATAEDIVKVSIVFRCSTSERLQQLPKCFVRSRCRPRFELCFSSNPQRNDEKCEKKNELFLLFSRCVRMRMALWPVRQEVSVSPSRELFMTLKVTSSQLFKHWKTKVRDYTYHLVPAILNVRNVETASQKEWTRLSRYFLIGGSAAQLWFDVAAVGQWSSDRFGSSRSAITRKIEVNLRNEKITSKPSMPFAVATNSMFSIQQKSSTMNDFAASPTKRWNFVYETTPPAVIKPTRFHFFVARNYKRRVIDNTEKTQDPRYVRKETDAKTNRQKGSADLVTISVVSSVGAFISICLAITVCLLYLRLRKKSQAPFIQNLSSSTPNSSNLVPESAANAYSSDSETTETDFENERDEDDYDIPGEPYSIPNPSEEIIAVDTSGVGV